MISKIYVFGFFATLLLFSIGILVMPFVDSALAQPIDPPGIEKRKARIFIMQKTYSPPQWVALPPQARASLKTQRDQKAAQLEAQGRKVEQAGGVIGKGRNK